MKALDIALNALTVLSVTIFLAYLGLHYDHGLFVTLPPEITGFFTQRPAVQYVAFGLLVAALIAKVPVGRAIKREDARIRR